MDRPASLPGVHPAGAHVRRPATPARRLRAGGRRADAVAAGARRPVIRRSRGGLGGAAGTGDHPAGVGHLGRHRRRGALHAAPSPRAAAGAVDAHRRARGADGAPGRARREPACGRGRAPGRCRRHPPSGYAALPSALRPAEPHRPRVAPGRARHCRVPGRAARGFAPGAVHRPRGGGGGGAAHRRHRPLRRDPSRRQPAAEGVERGGLGPPCPSLPAAAGAARRAG